jgi:signal peptidase I
MSRRRKTKDRPADILRTVLWAVLLALLFRSFVYQPFSIPSGSMVPTLLVGDYVFVSKFAYGYNRFSLPFWAPPIEGRLFGRLPTRGDVAVFRLPADPGQDYIKRIVGLPGDQVQMIGGVLTINGEPVRREPMADLVVDDGETKLAFRRFVETLPMQERDDGPLDDTSPYIVPEGHVFAMGDNREHSQDSRMLTKVGYIPLENIVGRADLRFLSVVPHQAWWKLWEWPARLRYDRLMSVVR